MRKRISTTSQSFILELPTSTAALSSARRIMRRLGAKQKPVLAVKRERALL